MEHTNDNYESDAAFILAEAKRMMGVEDKQKEDRVMICLMSGTESQIKNTLNSFKNLIQKGS